MRRMRRGQLIVEVMLILPVFLMVVFTIMEIGHLAFRTILIHHAAYETARIASLTAKPYTGADAVCKGGGAPGSMNLRVLILNPNTATLDAHAEATLNDPQSGCTSHDVVVKLTEKVPLVFPLTGLFLGTPPRLTSRFREVVAEVRMPIERPLFK